MPPAGGSGAFLQPARQVERHGLLRLRGSRRKKADLHSGRLEGVEGPGTHPTTEDHLAIPEELREASVVVVAMPVVVSMVLPLRMRSVGLVTVKVGPEITPPDGAGLDVEDEKGSGSAEVGRDLGFVEDGDGDLHGCSGWRWGTHRGQRFPGRW
jgi:hypothetical protein